MSRNNFRLLVLTLLLILCVWPALGESLISDEMIKEETVNYNDVLTVEKGVYERGFSAPATEYYPFTYSLRFEGDNARFGEFLVTRKTEVKAGDVLATFTVDVDEVEMASKRQALLRAQEAYESQTLHQQKAIEDQLDAAALEKDPFRLEILLLQIERARIALEQYSVEQQRLIQSLEKEIAELEAMYSQTTLVAPCDGVITNIAYKQTGDRLYKDEELITLYRKDGLLLRIENGNCYFRYGMNVTVAMGPAKARTYVTGRVVAASQMLAENKRGTHAYIHLENFNGEMPSRGTQTSVSGSTYYMEDVYLLPRRAVEREEGKFFISKLTDGIVQKRYINVALQGTTDVWVMQGIEEGETIIID